MTATATASLTAAGAHQVFRAVLAALARPGTVHPLPAAASPLPAALLPVLALADLDTGVCVLGGGDEWPTRIRTATSAPSVPLAQARMVAALGGLGPEELLAAPRGSAVGPELGALLSVSVAPASATGAPRFRFSGPGVDGHLDVTAALAPELVDARAEAVAEFPAGVDLLLVDDTGHLIAIPRSTRIERRAG